MSDSLDLPSLVRAVPLALAILAAWPIGAMQKVASSRLLPKSKQPPTAGTFVAYLIGWIERLLYLVALSVGQLTFIGVWIGLKVAARWRGFTEEGGEARHRYYIFLQGSGLSALWSLLAFAAYESACASIYAAIVFGALHLVAWGYWQRIEPVRSPE